MERRAKEEGYLRPFLNMIFLSEAGEKFTLKPLDGCNLILWWPSIRLSPSFNPQPALDQKESLLFLKSDHCVPLLTIQDQNLRNSDFIIIYECPGLDNTLSFCTHGAGASLHFPGPALAPRR